jgi:hypothetical protein
MNFVRSKSRNKMDPARMEDLVYVRHNLLQMEKVRAIGHEGGSAINWTPEGEDSEEDDGWEDAWQPARDVEAENFDASRVERVARSELRATAMEAASQHHIRPAPASRQPDSVDAAEAAASRSGRRIRRPQVLDL